MKKIFCKETFLMGVNVIICSFFFLYSINSIQYHNLYKTLNTFGKDTYTVGYYYRNCERLNNILENIDAKAYWMCIGNYTDITDGVLNTIRVCGEGLELKSGRYPTSPNEVLMFGNYKIGDKILLRDGEKTVVGLLKYSPYYWAIGETIALDNLDYFRAQKYCVIVEEKLPSGAYSGHTLFFNRSCLNEEQLGVMDWYDCESLDDIFGNYSLPYVYASLLLPLFLCVLALFCFRMIMIKKRVSEAGEYMFYRLRDHAEVYCFRFRKSIILKLRAVFLVSALIFIFFVFNIGRILFCTFMIIFYFLMKKTVVRFVGNTLDNCCPDVDSLHDNIIIEDKTLRDNLAINFELCRNRASDDAVYLAGACMGDMGLETYSHRLPKFIDGEAKRIYDFLIMISMSDKREFEYHFDNVSEELRERIRKIERRMNISVKVDEV